MKMRLQFDFIFLFFLFTFFFFVLTQKMGTVHGEELPYVFGAPLAESLNHFPRNFTKSEVALSEAFMIYVGNFVRTG